jgi:hypothetical protein
MTEELRIGSDYSRHPIPGQLSMNLHAAGERNEPEQHAQNITRGEHESGAEWIARLTREHGQ